MSQEENSSLVNSQEIRDNSELESSGSEENKITIREEVEKVEELEETTPAPQASSESETEKKAEDKTDKIKVSDLEIQSPIEAMIEKRENTPPEPEGRAEEKVEEEKETEPESFKEIERSETEPEEVDSQYASSEETVPPPAPEYELGQEEIREVEEESQPETEPAEPKSFSQVKHPEEQKVLHRGVAHFKNNIIKIAGGFKLHAGDEMKIGERQFELKHLESSKKPLYWGILALGIIALFFVFSFGLTGNKDSGKMVGVIVEKGTGVFLPNAMIEIKELGKKVQSNDLGFFSFDLLGAGSYEIRTQLKGYQPASENVVIVRKQMTTTVIELSPEQARPAVATSQPGRTEPRSRPVVPSQPRSSLGSVKIETNVPGVIVYMDNRYLGVGNNLYPDIDPGSHSFRLSKDGYQDWSGNLAINERATSRIKVNLNRIEGSSGASSSSRSQENFLASAQREYEAGNFAGAVENYTKGLLSDPRNAEALMGRGNSYLKIGDKNKAIADLSQGAKLFEGKGNYGKAVLCYTSLLSLTPNDQNSLYSRAQDYVKLGEYDKGISDLKKVTEQNPKFFNGFVELGDAQYKAEDYKGAVESYSKAKKLNPNSRQIYIKLAITYTALKDKSGAKKNYEKFKELTTLADRETMKDDPEWVKVLKFLGESSEKEF